MTAAEIETILKRDVLPSVTLRKCGARFIAWYDMIRLNWK